MEKQIKKVILGLFILLFSGSCKTSKTSGDSDMAFKQYLIDNNKMDQNTAINDSYYDKYYLEYLDFLKKEELSSNPYLKLNKVYVYQGDDKEITFCVYSDNGKLYLGDAYKTGGMLLGEPKDGIRRLRKPIELLFFGFYELENTIIKNTRYKKTPSREWYDCDVGYINNDSIILTGHYSTNKFGDFEKKWLAKTHKTNFKLVYQPGLRAIKSRNYLGSDAFLIEGFFNVERNLQEEKMLQLLENAKY